MYSRDCFSADAKCVRGCRGGGVCTAVKYDCICTVGFHKEGSQCVKGTHSCIHEHTAFMNIPKQLNVLNIWQGKSRAF